MLRVASTPNTAGLASKLFTTQMFNDRTENYCCAVGGGIADVNDIPHGQSHSRAGAASLTLLGPDFTIYIELSM